MSEEYENVVTDIIRQNNSARQQAIMGLEDTPDKAVRALQLARGTGANPNVIMGDLDNFDQSHKRMLASTIIQSNPHLSEYINANPIHSKLSSDDWGQLDDVSNKLKRLAMPAARFVFPGTSLVSSIDPLHAAGVGIEGFKKTWVESQEGRQLKDEELQNYPLGSAVSMALRMPIDFASSLFKGATEAVAAASEAGYRSLGGSESSAKSFARDIAGMTEMMLQGMGPHGMPAPTPAQLTKLHGMVDVSKPWLDSGKEPPRGLHPEIDKLKKEQNDLDLDNLKEATRTAQQSLTRERDADIFADYIRQHSDATIGISPEAIQRLYGEKLPELEDGLLGHVEGLRQEYETALATGADIQIPLADWLAKVDPEVAKELYDDVRVRPGGITKNEAKLATEQKEALQTLYSIDEPKGKTAYELDREEFRKKNNLPEATPEEVAKTIRFRIGQIERDRRASRVAGEELDPHGELYGLRTRLRELEGNKRDSNGPLPDPLPSLRASSALEPLFSIGDRKLELKKINYEPELGPGSRAAGHVGFHDFQMLDENGSIVGSINISEQKGGKQVYIDMIQGGPSGSKLYNPNFFGLALIRDLYRQIKAEFPDAFGPDGLGITGHRVSGAREKAGSGNLPSASPVIKWDDPATLDIGAAKQLFTDAVYKPVSDILEAAWKPSKELSQREVELSQAITAELSRLTPKQLDVSTPSRLRRTSDGREVRGTHISYSDRNPFILVALDSTDPIGVARHEAIHHLRQQGFFTEGEWSTLTRAARDNGWQEKFGIDRRYPTLDTANKLEESIADGFRDWKAGKEVPKEAAKIFERLKELFEAIKAKFREILGREVTWEELFQKVDEGEVGGREGNKPRQEGAYKESIGEPELPGITRMEDRPLFRTPATIGMSAQEVRLYEKALAEQQASDIKWSEGRALKEQRKRLTAEWKIEYKNTRAEVEADMSYRPDVAADLLFARGELFGVKLPEKVKIDPVDLTAQERAALPKDYVAKEGKAAIDLDDVAGHLGYPSGRVLIDNLVAYNLRKTEANMSAKAFLGRITDIETENRMKSKLGDLEQNILEEAKDQITSETQLNLISQEVLALGIRNNGEFTINKQQMRDWVANKFADSSMRGITSDAFLNSAGKKGRAAEIALLQGKIDMAYREKQGQFMSMLFAKEARQLEKDQKRFASTAKKLAKRDVKGLDLEYQDVIQQLLLDVGVPTRRSTLEIQASQAKWGFTSLEGFIASAAYDGWGPNVTNDIIAGRTKALDQMTVGEFREFKTAIDSLNYIGRQVDKINIEGAKRDFAILRKEIVGNITSRPRRDRETQTKGLRHFLYGIDAALTKNETLLRALDLGDEMGPLIENISKPLAESKHKKYTMQEELGTKIKDINVSMPKEWAKSTKDVLSNTWFMDPSSGQPFKVTRSDLINIMSHWGNRSNIKKFTMGYGSPDPVRGATKAEAAAFEARMKQYIDTHARPEDWKFVQKIWDIYEGYRDESEKVWQSVSGTQPKFYDAVPVDTPHGQMKGGYVPVSRDLYATNSKIVEAVAQGPFDFNYPNFNTPQGHLKERTGAVYFVDFRSPLTDIPMRMQQVIHDIAYRDSVMAASKILRDNEIRNSIRNHYGKEYENTLDSWLLKTARGTSVPEKEVGAVNDVLRKVRLNLIQYALPFNYVVNFTPDVGNFNLKAIKNYYADWETNYNIAQSKSKEIPHAIYNMDRDFSEAMQRMVGEGKMDAAKTKVARWGYTMATWISQQFRSATFIDRYNTALMAGKTEAEAAAIADVHVRDQYGSTAIHDLPSVMTTGEAGRMLTILYGFWNNQYNRMRPIPDAIRHGDYMDARARAFGTIVVGAMFGGLIANPARQEDSIPKRLLKAIPMHLMGQVPFLREASTMAIEGIPPRTPWGTAIQSVSALGNDIVNAARGKPVKAPVKHAAAFMGLAFGVPGTLQAGRTGQGIADVMSGKQHPRDFIEWSRLLLTGEAKLKRQGER